MADFVTIKRDSGKDELAKIASGLPKDFQLPIKTRKVVIEEKIQKTSDELTSLEIELGYFTHLDLAGVKKAKELLPLAQAKCKEKKDFLEWLCKQ